MQVTTGSDATKNMQQLLAPGTSSLALADANPCLRMAFAQQTKMSNPLIGVWTKKYIEIADASPSYLKASLGHSIEEWYLIGARNIILCRMQEGRDKGEWWNFHHSENGNEIAIVQHSAWDMG